MMRPVGAVLFGASLALCACVPGALAQERTPEQEAARAQACVPPPCEAATDYPPCERPEIQHRLSKVAITAIAVEDGPIVRPLGGAITGAPELSVCVRSSEETFLLYLPAIDEAVLRLGILSALQTAMHARAPVDIAYGLPNGALRKIEGVQFGAPADSGAVSCGYGDFDRCDTGYEAKPGAERSRSAVRITRINLIGYGKGSRAVQIFTDSKTSPSFLIDPAAAPERFLHLMNFAFTAQITGVPVEIDSAPGLPPAEAQDRSPVPAFALDITPAAMR